MARPSLRAKSVWDSRRVTLAQDETIDFVIGRGADDSESGSFLKIAATVTLVADGLSPGELHFQAPSIPASENSVLLVWASRQGGMAWPASIFAFVQVWCPENRDQNGE